MTTGIIEYMKLKIQKTSISLAKPLYDFIDRYQGAHHCKSRSEVISIALYLLEQQQLEECYREANNEIDASFEAADGDGIDHEAW